MVTSDHSPAPASMKADSNFFKVWGGISGCQSLLQLLLAEGYERRQLPLTMIAALTSEYVAQRFGPLPGKGSLAVGTDADIVLVDLQVKSLLQAGQLFYRHRHSPYVGKTLRGRIVRTMVRGRTVFLEGKVVSEPVGRLCK
jgi:allantoinase